MNASRLVKRVLVDLGKGCLASLASILGLILGGMVTGLLRLPAPTMPPGIDANTILPLMFLSGILISILLGECFQRLYRSYWRRLLTIWLCNYLLYYLLNTLDAMLFFAPGANMSTSILLNLFPALFASAVIALVWRPGRVGLAGVTTLASFPARKTGTWAWRLFLAWLVFPPIYYAVGRVAGLFTQHYYEVPSLNLGLTLPPIQTLLAMQVLRGALFLLAVLPIIRAWKGSRTVLWYWVGAVIFIQIAATLIFQAYWYPLGLRIPHAVELFVDSFAQAYLYVLLLFVPRAGAANQA